MRASTEATVTFLPHRLNRQPVIVRGLTADELWITVGLSGLCGLILGIPCAVFMRSIAMAPTLVVVTITTGIFVGGGLLRRYKRGRPEMWLYRQLQWWACRRIPACVTYMGAGQLITRSGYWTTRRMKQR